MTSRLRPIFTEEVQSPTAFVTKPNSAYFYGVTAEPRTDFAASLTTQFPDVDFHLLEENNAGSFSCPSISSKPLFPRIKSDLRELIQKTECKNIYIDITGLGHTTWAPLLRVCLEEEIACEVVYVEPEQYTSIPSPDSGIIYDLSERIDGIKPVPQFTSLAEPDDSVVSFVPLLGFEGARFSHMLNELEPPLEQVIPVIGIPGFQPHYPFETLKRNAAPIEKARASRQMKYAPSNCPFSVYYLLEDLLQNQPGKFLKLGLIGTKPHALGAFLLAIKYPDGVEIIYDHAKRKAGRTSGQSRCLVYRVSDFLS